MGNEPVDQQALALTHAIALQESGGSSGKPNYNAVGDAGTSKGAYQWQPGNFEAAAKSAGLDPNDFSPENQDKVAYSEIKGYKEKGYDPGQIASLWNSGSPNNWQNHSGTTTINGKTISYDTPAYVKGVQKHYQELASQSNNPISPLLSPTQQSTPIAPANPGSTGDTGFLQGLQEDLSGTNPESLGTQAGNAIKGVGNFLFPSIGDAYHDLKGDSTKTGLQQAGDLGSTALSAATLIPGVDVVAAPLKAALLGGKAIEAGAEGANLASKAAPGLLGGIGKNAALGGAYGATQGIGSGSTDPTEIAGDATIGAVGGAALGVGGKAISGLLGKASEDGTLQKAIQDTMPLENKATRIDAMRNSMPGEQGGVTRKGLLGTSTIIPSDEDIARGKAVVPYLNGEKDPVAQVQNLNKGIQDVSKETDSFLDQNTAPANFADMRNYMETNKPTASLQKDPVALENYNRATQDALDTLYATMKKTAKASGDFGSNTSAADIRAARIAVDQQISKELGENTFGSPQYKGIKAAEIDTRNLLNRMSEDMLRYPGQLEKLNKLNDFVSASRARGIDVDMNNPQVRSQLERQFGLTMTQETEAAAQKLSDAHTQMSHLYDARDNVIDRYQRKIGKNKLQETIENSPVAGFIANTAKKAIPFGVADHIL